MHTFGHPCRIDEIVDICNEFNIPLVEDAAESLGSYYKGKHTGTFGKIGVVSFNGNKILTTGGGGMLLFNDVELALRAKHLTTQAKVPHLWEFNHDAIGYNYRMPNINAALGLAQLEQLQEFLEQKRKIAEKYSKFFANSNQEISFFSEPTGSKANYWLNAILLKNRNERNMFLEYSNSKGVMTRPAWTLMNELPMFIDCRAVGLNNAKYIADRLVNIPSSVLSTSDRDERVRQNQTT
jgi:dTDP-4-amino-4,6-dideoxygalactose transaminase